MYAQSLLEKIKSKTAKIAVIGLGYVGIPLISKYIENGFPVLGLDVDQSKVDMLKKGESFLSHISHETISKLFKNRSGVQLTSQYSALAEADVIIICLPTPLGKYLEPDLSYIQLSIEAALPYLKKGQAISLESTTYPGTTEEEILTRLQKKGFKPGEDIFVLYSPEREDPGNMHFTTSTIPKVVSGYSKDCLEVAKALYSQVIEKIVPVSTLKVAETTKLLENIYRAVNIGLVNELKVICHSMNIDIWEVIDAAATKPFGFTPFYPGPGLGGHCIPIDPFYLSYKAKEFGITAQFIELSGQVNRNMPKWVTDQVILAVNYNGCTIPDAKVLVLGVAYKKNINDFRESPAIEIIKNLKKLGANVDYYDPFIPEFEEHGLKMKSVGFDRKTIESADVVLVATDHDVIDYQNLREWAKLIVDTRNRFKETSKKVVKV